VSKIDCTGRNRRSGENRSPDFCKSIKELDSGWSLSAKGGFILSEVEEPNDKKKAPAIFLKSS
jgi:hypothetical protein